MNEININDDCFDEIKENHILNNKNKCPKQLSWKEIKEKYGHIINRSKVLNGEINYTHFHYLNK